MVFSNAIGNKDVQISQTDAAGNIGSVNRTFNRTSTGPAIAFTSPAANFAFKTKMTMTGTCQTGLNVYFSGAGINSTSNMHTMCTNGLFSAEVEGGFTSGDGAKTIIVTQTNTSGQAGSASRTFVRDNLAPGITLVSPVANAEAKSGVQLVGNCENGLNVSISGTGISAASSLACANGMFSVPITFSANDGVKNIVMSQTDAAGNIGSVSRDFKRDNVAPVIAITSPAANTLGSTGLTIGGTCEGSYQVTASGSGVSSPVRKACSAGTFSIDVVFTAGDGNKVVQVAQTDGAGNSGTNSRTFVRGSVPVLDGVTLYTQNCAACHGALASSAKKDRSATLISGAIAAIPSMGTTNLRALTSAQISAIADALKSPPVLASTATDIGAQPLKRLNNREFRNTIFDLTGVDYPGSDSFPANGIPQISTVLTERYFEAATAAATGAMTQINARAGIVGKYFACDYANSSSGDACVTNSPKSFLPQSVPSTCG